MKKMNAVVTYAPYDNRYEEVDIPKVEAGEILIRVKGCGICAGDIKAYHGGVRIWGTSVENRYIEPPCIGGHEFYGEIMELGEGVTGFQIGDCIVSEQIVPCNVCKFCLEGIYWMCTRAAVFGFKPYANGGFAEFVKIDKNCINHKLPGNFTVEQAVMIEPIACGMHAIERANIKSNDVVVIAGLGAIGLSMVNIAALHLPKMIIGLEVKTSREAIAKEYGVDVLLNPKHCNVAKEIKKLTKGLGCDVYVEASGNPQSVTQGLESIKNLGRFVQMGVFAEEVKADWNIIGDGKEMTIIGSHLSGLTYPSVIKGIASELIKTDGLITHSFHLKDWKTAFEVAEKDENAVKVMLIP